jgi:NADH-quinone oxidoreductase subunit N
VIQTPSIDWGALSPYLILLTSVGAIMLVAVFAPPRLRSPLGASLAGLAFVGTMVAAIILYESDTTGEAIVGDYIRSDRLADLTHVILATVGLLAVLVAHRESNAPERRAELYALLVSAVGGMAFFVAANNLISLFLGLEWFSISLYILCAITLDRAVALEAGLKYLIAGGFGSAILLFGSALVYGATSEIGFEQIATATDTGNRFFLVTGLAMLLVGLAFKTSAAPFHQWTPDVYEGAPTAITAFMAAATKVAALVLTLRFLTTAFPTESDLWTIALGVISAVSLVWGNLGAITQRNLKRLLAYSSIAQAGFLLMTVAAGNEIGGSALLYYLIAYSALSIGAFAVVAARERELQRPVTLDNIAGLGWERPFHGAAMSMFMIGFIGLPPVALFLGKFLAFAALWDRGWVWLMIIGAIFTAVSVYYYLGVVGAMYSRGTKLALAPAGGSPPRDRALDLAIVASLVIGIGTFFGIDSLLDVIGDAVDFLPYPF